MSNDQTIDETKIEEKLTDQIDAAADAPEDDAPIDEVDGAVTEDEGSDDEEDSLTFSNGVIEKVVALGLRDIPGVVGMRGGFINRVQDAFGLRDARKGVTVEQIPDGSVRVNLSVLLAYGAFAPQVFEDVKRAVVESVTSMIGLEVASVSMRIEDVLTPEEIEARSPKLPAAEEPEALPAAEDEPEPETPEFEAPEGDEATEE